MSTIGYASLRTLSGDNVALEGMCLSGDVRGLMLDMRVIQRFRNNTKCHAEFVYTFPLPWRAVLMNVEVSLGNRKLTGTVVDKEEAEFEYEEALSSGDTAIMLEKNRDHSYSLNLGNIAPEEACVVCIHYVQTLQFEQRGLRLLIPTVIAPRYSGTGNGRVSYGGLAPHLQAQHSLTAEYPFELELRIHGELAHGRASSPSHNIAIHVTDNVLILALARDAVLDRDFILVLDQLRQDSVVTIGADKLHPDQCVVMASFCPRIPQYEPMPVAVKLLVDCSGSMVGDSIAAARRALQSIVSNLKPGDRYSLSRFGDDVQHRSRTMWKVTPVCQLAAQRWVSLLDADLGGTEMELALRSTFALGKTAGSDVLMITDGEISDIDGVIDSAVTSGHRIFVVGIGSSPAECHLRRLAQATSGACDFVAPGEAVEPAILRMFARLRSPRMERVSIVWPDECEPIWMSALNASVFDGDTVNVFASLRRQPFGGLRLRAKRRGADQDEEIGRLEFNSREVDNICKADYQLSRMAASVRIAETNNRTKGGGSMQELAVDYQLVTDLTNFLLIHERAEDQKALDMPVLHQVQQMVPAGWAGMGDIRFSRSIQKPAVWRRDTTASMDGSSGAQTYDVPAFLRKDCSDEIQYSVGTSMFSSYSRQVEELLDKSNHRFWVAQHGVKELTPLGLSSWLGLMPKGDWPTTYLQLLEIGVSNEVIEWLSLIIAGASAETSSETRGVASFLHIFAGIELSRELLAKTRKGGGFRGAMYRLREVFGRSPQLGRKQNNGQIIASLDADLVLKISSALKDMDALRWPDLVLEVG